MVDAGDAIEVILAQREERIQVIAASKTDLIAVATKQGGGAVCVIRTIDNTIHLSKTFGDLEEDGAHMCVVYPV